MGAPRKKNPQLKEKILEVVEQFYFENYRSPSLAEIAAEIGVVRNTVHRYLKSRLLCTCESMVRCVSSPLVIDFLDFLYYFKQSWPTRDAECLNS